MMRNHAWPRAETLTPHPPLLIPRDRYAMPIPDRHLDFKVPVSWLCGRLSRSVHFITDRLDTVSPNLYTQSELFSRGGSESRSPPYACAQQERGDKVSTPLPWRWTSRSRSSVMRPVQMDLDVSVSDVGLPRDQRRMESTPMCTARGDADRDAPVPHPPDEVAPAYRRVLLFWPRRLHRLPVFYFRRLQRTHQGTGGWVR